MPKHLDLNSMPRHIIAFQLEAALLEPRKLSLLFHRKTDPTVEALRNFQRKIRLIADDNLSERPLDSALQLELIDLLFIQPLNDKKQDNALHLLRNEIIGCDFYHDQGHKMVIYNYNNDEDEEDSINLRITLENILGIFQAHRCITLEITQKVFKLFNNLKKGRLFDSSDRIKFCRNLNSFIENLVHIDKKIENNLKSLAKENNNFHPSSQKGIQKELSLKNSTVKTQKTFSYSDKKSNLSEEFCPLLQSAFLEKLFKQDKYRIVSVYQSHFEPIFSLIKAIRTQKIYHRSNCYNLVNRLLKHPNSEEALTVVASFFNNAPEMFRSKEIDLDAVVNKLISPPAKAITLQPIIVFLKENKIVNHKTRGSSSETLNLFNLLANFNEPANQTEKLLKFMKYLPGFQTNSHHEISLKDKLIYLIQFFEHVDIFLQASVYDYFFEGSFRSPYRCNMIEHHGIKSPPLRKCLTHPIFFAKLLQANQASEKTQKFTKEPRTSSGYYGWESIKETPLSLEVKNLLEDLAKEVHNKQKEFGRAPKPEELAICASEKEQEEALPRYSIRM